MTMSLRGNRGVRLDRMPVVDKLTPTEAKVWELFQQGKTPQEIADATGMKRNSVTRRLSEAKEKVAAQ